MFSQFAFFLKAGTNETNMSRYRDATKQDQSDNTIAIKPHFQREIPSVQFGAVHLGIERFITDVHGFQHRFLRRLP